MREYYSVFMHIIFSYPLFYLLALGVIPVVVHLMARAQPKEKQFSSLFFLSQVVRKQVRLNRPTDILLLTLRTLLVLFLVGAFLLPFLSGTFAEEKTGRTVLIVLDRSASMAAADGYETRMSRAIELADKLIQGLKSKDKINLIWADRVTTSFFDAPMSSKEMVSNVIRQTYAKNEEADMLSALILAEKQASSSPNSHSEIFVISDFQDANWKTFDIGKIFPTERVVHFLNVATKKRIPNCGVTHMQVLPSTPLVGQKVTILAQLTNFDDAPVRLPVRMVMGEQRATQTVEIPPHQTISTTFMADVPLRAEEFLTTVSIDADSFPADDSCSTVFNAVKRFTVMISTQDESQLGFFLKALQSVPFFDVKIINGLPSSLPDIFVTNNTRSTDVPYLLELCQQGACVVVIPCFSGDSSIAGFLGAAEPSSIQAKTVVEGESPFRLVCHMPFDPAFAMYGQGKGSVPLQASIFSRLNIEPSICSPSCEFPVMYEDGIPAIIRRPVGVGSLIVWNSPTTGGGSTWGSSPHFLPFLAEFLLHSRNIGQVDAPLIAGESLLTWTISQEITPEDIVLRNASVEDVSFSITPASKGEHMLTSLNPVDVGIYTWQTKLGGHILHRQCVNFPVIESDLIQIEEEKIPRLVSSQSTEASMMVSSARYPIWQYFLLAAALCFLAENLVNFFFMRKRITQ